MLLVNLSNKLDSLKGSLPDWLDFIKTTAIKNAEDVHGEGQYFFLDDGCHRIEGVDGDFSHTPVI